MRIAIIVSRFPEVTESYIIHQIRALRNHGQEVHLFSYNKSSSYFSINLTEHVSYKEKMPGQWLKRFLKALFLIIRDHKELKFRKILKVINFFKYGRDAASLQLFYKGYWFLGKQKFDIIHAHFGPVGCSVLELKRFGILKEARIVVSLHGYYIEKKFIQDNLIKVNFLKENADLILVNTLYSLQVLQKSSGILGNIKILPVGIDEKFFKKTSQTTNIFNIIFCGRFVEIKGPDLCIDIVHALRRRGYKSINLHLIGDGPMRSFLEDSISQKGLNDCIFITGILNREEVKKYFNEASLFLLPGRTDKVLGKAETQGVVIQEAQSMEIPVVISDAGGMKYGIVNGETGFIVKEGDLQGFTNVVERIILNPSSGITMGKKGRKFVEENYSVENIYQDLLKLYETIV